MTALHTDEYRRFAGILSEARQNAGLSQGDLAERLGVPQYFISKYESSRRRLDVIEFVRIAFALDLEPSVLLARLGSDVGEFHSSAVSVAARKRR